MKTINLNIIKKGRVWFECENQGYKCKLKINEFSKDLTMGKHELTCEDISIHSRYGTELRYEMCGEKTDEKVFLSHIRFNKWLVKDCQQLGGIWDYETKSWVFSAIVSDKVEDLEAKYNSNFIEVEIKAKEDIYGYQESVTFCGYTIARATSRDSGATLGDGVYKISGAIKSGGSMKNWNTFIEEGSIFRLTAPTTLLEHENKEMWEVTIIS